MFKSRLEVLRPRGLGTNFGFYCQGGFNSPSHRAEIIVYTLSVGYATIRYSACRFAVVDNDHGQT